MTYIVNADPQRSPPPDLGFELNWIRDQVMELYRWSRTDHEERFCADWLYYYKHYKNWVDKRVNPDDYKSNIGVGIAYPIVEIVFSHLQEPWLSGDDIVKAYADHPDAEEPAPRVAGLVNRRIVNAPHAFQQHAQVVRSALLTGRGILKPFMQYQRPRTVYDRIADMVGGFRLGSHVAPRQFPPGKRMAFRCVDPFDWWKTPGAKSDYEWTFERYYLTTSQVQARVESGEWTLLQIEVKDADAIGYDEWRQRRLNLEGYAPHDHVRSSLTQERPHHRVVEFQGRLALKKSQADSETYQDVKVVILNEQFVALNQPLRSWDGNPEYLVWEPVQEPMSERPIGLIEPMEDVLLELNDYENIALDNARKILESPLLVDPNSTKETRFLLGPAQINWVKNPRNSVVPLEMKDLPSSFYHQIGFLNDLIQRITGVSDYFGGMNTSDTGRLSKTATGMQLMANLSATRFGPLIASLDRDYYRPLAQWVLKTSRLWMTQPETFRQGNPTQPFATVTPEDLDAELEFKFKTRALDPKTEERRQNFIRMVEQMQVLSQGVMQAGTHYVDFYELAKILLDEFDHQADVDKIMPAMPQAQGAPMGATGPTAGMMVPGGAPPEAFVPPIAEVA